MRFVAESGFSPTSGLLPFRSGLLLSLSALFPVLLFNDKPDGTGWAEFAIYLRVSARKAIFAHVDIVLQADKTGFVIILTLAFFHVFTRAVSGYSPVIKSSKMLTQSSG